MSRPAARVTRDVSRARARVESFARVTRADRERIGLYVYPDVPRPRVRAECTGDGEHAERPCPWASCRYHLYLDVHPVHGSIKINVPDREVWEMADSCALDVADHGGLSLEGVAQRINTTRERVRQIERSALESRKAAFAALAEGHAPQLPEPVRRCRKCGSAIDGAGVYCSDECRPRNVLYMLRRSRAKRKASHEDPSAT